MDSHDDFKKGTKRIFAIMALGGSLIGLLGVLLFVLMQNPDLILDTTPEAVLEPVPKNGTAEPQDQALAKDLQEATGLAPGDGMLLVAQNCTPCHSAKLITQNRMTREGWSATIKWMQDTQNLWDLGENEKPILDYLATHYAPEDKGRRGNLENIAWYRLK